jgi:hypothetical protein
MVERGHQVRLTQATLANHDYWSALVGADGLDTLQKVMGWICDLQELLRGDLRGTSVGVVGELNGRPFEALTSELFS